MTPQAQCILSLTLGGLTVLTAVVLTLRLFFGKLNAWTDRLNSFATIKYVNDQVENIEKAMLGNAALAEDHHHEVTSRIELGFRRMDDAKTGQDIRFYDKLDVISKDITTVKVDVAGIKGACRACDIQKAG